MAYFQRTLYINIYIYIYIYIIYIYTYVYIMCCVLMITSSYHPVQLTNCLYLHFLLIILNPQSLGHHLPNLVTCGIPDSSYLAAHSRKQCCGQHNGQHSCALQTARQAWRKRGWPHSLNLEDPPQKYNCQFHAKHPHVTSAAICLVERSFRKWRIENDLPWLWEMTRGYPLVMSK